MAQQVCDIHKEQQLVVRVTVQGLLVTRTMHELLPHVARQRVAPFPEHN